MLQSSRINFQSVNLFSRWKMI